MESLWYGPAVRRPPRRLLVGTVAGAAVAALATAAAARTPTAASLRADRQAVASERRAAVLDLYSLDSRLAAAGARLDGLRARTAALRAERARLERVLAVARAGERTLERRLAARLRMLFDRGAASALDVVLGAGSLGDALTSLDDLDRMSSADRELLGRLRAARTHADRVRAALAARGVRLGAALRAAAAETRRLAGVRAERAGYLARLARREELDRRRLAELEALARAAEAKARALTRAPPAAAAAVPARPAEPGSITVLATGYCLSGRTATGIPAGWGVAAVDPDVVPLGTHLVVPGYGEAVAADTGGSISGARIDLWFPTCAQAGGWGSRSVTIALH